MKTDLLDKLALLLLVVGGLNWGLIGWFDYNLVDALFGEGSVLARLVYSLVGLAALYGVYMLANLHSRPTTTHKVA